MNKLTIFLKERKNLVQHFMIYIQRKEGGWIIETTIETNKLFINQMEFQMETRSLNIYTLVKNLVDFLSDPPLSLSLSERWTLINRRARS